MSLSLFLSTHSGDSLFSRHACFFGLLLPCMSLFSLTSHWWAHIGLLWPLLCCYAPDWLPFVFFQPCSGDESTTASVKALFFKYKLKDLSDCKHMGRWMIRTWAILEFSWPSLGHILSAYKLSSFVKHVTSGSPKGYCNTHFPESPPFLSGWPASAICNYRRQSPKNCQSRKSAPSQDLGIWHSSIFLAPWASTPRFNDT